MTKLIVENCCVIFCDECAYEIFPHELLRVTDNGRSTYHFHVECVKGVCETVCKKQAELVMSRRGNAKIKNRH